VECDNGSKAILKKCIGEKKHITKSRKRTEETTIHHQKDRLPQNIVFVREDNVTIGCVMREDNTWTMWMAWMSKEEHMKGDRSKKSQRDEENLLGRLLIQK
jgi:hypothetical protein